MPHRSPTAGVLTLIGTAVGIVATIALIVALFVIHNRRTLMVRDEYGKWTKKTVSKAEYKRIVAERKVEEEAEERRKRGLPPADVEPAPPAEPDNGQPRSPESPRVTPTIPKSDPKLAPGRPTNVRAGVGVNYFHACGSLLSKYSAPLRHVTVTAYVDGTRGWPVSYEYVPARGTIRYSVPLPAGAPADAEVTIVATAGEELPADTIVWEIDPSNIGEGEIDKEGTAGIVWKGQTRNPTTTPVKDVRIYCDFFFAEGLYAGSATAKVRDDGIIGPGRRGYFSLTSENSSLLGGRLLVVRAVGQKY